MLTRAAQNRTRKGIPEMKNFHPLAPATSSMKKARHEAIAAYAAEMAGSEFDLDPDLEAAGIEHLCSANPELLTWME